MKAPRSKRVIFIFADIAVLNFSLILTAAAHLYFFKFESGSLRDLVDLVAAGNLVLTLPWVLLFLLFGFYRDNWHVSFFSVGLAVTLGIFLLHLLTSEGGIFLHSSSGGKLIVIYWCTLMLSIYASRFFVTAAFDAWDRRRHGALSPTIAGAGYKEKNFGISTGVDLVEHSLTYLFWKRAIDLLGGLAAFAFFLPTLLILSALIKLTDPKGPVFFRQERLGKNGRLFRIFKFRTMVHNAEQVLKESRALYEEYILNNFKLPGERDPRITRIGSFLRKTSLDELPQLFNVLSGAMSLVGPRPIVPDELIKYDKYRKKFLSVKPGMTGWWQVAGRSNVDYPDRIYLEMYYVENASVWFDLKILLETLPTVMFAKGAH